MKRLKNKKTGENYEMTMPIVFNIKTSGGGEHTVSCESIKELNEKWQDYEEPKEWYWFIEDNGIIQRSCHYEDLHPSLDKARKEIGNYFNTREEAELIVRKLEAWKRLRDKGFRFEGRDKPNYGEKFIIKCSLPKETLVIDVAEDLDLLFCPEVKNEI